MLLSVASQQELIDQHVYLLLMGELQRCAVLRCAVLVQQLGLPHTCYYTESLPAWHRVLSGWLPCVVAAHTFPPCLNLGPPHPCPTPAVTPLLTPPLRFLCGAGVTALTLLVTPFLLQVSNRLTPRPKGWNGTGPGPGDLELSNGGPQVCSSQVHVVQGFSYCGGHTR